MADEVKLPPVPVGVQRLLRLAAVSAPFLAELERDAERAAAAARVALTASERAMLRAIQPEQLRGMIAIVPEPEIGLASELETQADHAVEALIEHRVFKKRLRWTEEPPEREASITDLGIIVGDRPQRAEFPGATPHPAEPTAGIRPDEPPARPNDLPPVLGIRPEPAPERLEVMPVSRGIRPGLPSWPRPVCSAASSAPRPWLVIAIGVALLIVLSLAAAFIAGRLGTP